MPQSTAIVTGAGKNSMGEAIALELAARNYIVYALSSSGAPGLQDKKNIVSCTGSVTNTQDLEQLVHKIMNEQGRIDAVVNSTGHPPSGQLLTLSDEAWQRGMELVFLNVVRMARLVTPHMITQGHGAFVNISTFAAFEPDPLFPISGAMRAALGHFAKAYANEFATHNIRMNNLLPGYFETYAINAEQRKQIPMGRSGTRDEIAKTTAFLLSADAGYITGQNIRIDGGITRSV